MTFPFGAIGPAIIGVLGSPVAIQVQHFAPGSFGDGGYWVPGASTTTTVSAAVMPAGPREIQLLPENERTKEAITVYTLAALCTSDVASSDESDRVTWHGRQYKVIQVEDWVSQTGYARAIATRIGE